MATASAGDKLMKEIDRYASKVYKVDTKDPNYQRLPKCWNSRDRAKSLKLSHFSLTVTYGSNYAERHDSNYTSQDPASIRADAPIPLTTGLYYFEITLANKSCNGKSFSVGVVTKSSSLSKLPGTEHSSFGYNNDGSVCHGSTNSSTKFGPRIVENDTVGCGVDFMSRSLFFTRNGIFLGKAFEGKVPASPSTRLYPAVGLQGRGTRLNANFGQRPFMYAFDSHITRERITQENNLISRVCKEEFAGSKMRELVSGYLVHHGYVATAQAFSRWASVATEATERTPKARDILSVRNTAETSSVLGDKPSDLTGLQSRSCESHLCSRQPTAPHESNTPILSPTQKASTISRRHSDSSCIDPPSSTVSQLPGLSSMLHRRRLRALCKRCQYGKAASTLNQLYPEVLERCPELLVQLRCRQLIEMMRRHAIRRGHAEAFDLASESLSSSSTIAPPKMKRLSDPQKIRPSCCLANKSMFSVGNSENGTVAMDVDICPERSSESLATADYQAHEDHEWTECLDTNYAHEAEEYVLGDDEDDDDDDFGLNDDTGLGTNSADAGSLHDMEVDADSSTKIGSVDAVSTSHASLENSELPCLMRHIQFARSLVNLVREVRVKTGGLSLETERLLQQSVSLLAYSSPTSVSCPLRGLLDPAWRDTIANVINSAVLEAHDLPVQPALEQGLRALQRCFQDQYFIEAQTLGHFLLYHVSPSQLAKADAVARCEPVSHRTPKRHRTSPLLSNGDTAQSDETPLQSGDSQSVGRRPLPNGHTSELRRARRSSSRVTGRLSNSGVNDTLEYSSSSSEEVANKVDDEEEDEDEEDESGESGQCRGETIDENYQDDEDDDEHGTNRSAVSTGRPHGIHSATSGTTRNDPSTPSDRSPSSGSSSGRTHVLHPLSTPTRVRHFTTVYRQSANGSDNIQRSNRFTLSRYCPALLVDPSHTRILATIPASSLSTARRPDRVFRADGVGSLRASQTENASVSTPITVETLTNSNRASSPPVSRSSVPTPTSQPPSDYPGSTFNDLVSMSYPQHAEFIAAVNDALKSYAGSLFASDDDLSGPSLSNHLGRSDRDRPPGRDGPSPPYTGSSTCAP